MSIASRCPVTPFHIAVGSFTAGSAEVHRIREEILALAGAGHDPLLVAPEGFPEMAGVETIRFPAPGVFGALSSSGPQRAIIRYARQRPPTCLHAHGWDAVKPAHHAARELRVPLVCDLHDAAARGRNDRSLLALADHVVASAASSGRRLAQSVRAGGVTYVPGSLDLVDLPPAPPVAFRLPTDRDLLLVCAPLAEGDPDTLLAALDAALVARPALHLVLIGEPIGASFMKAVSAHRMVPRVTFGGLPPLSAAARLAAEARAMLIAIADPGVIEPYVLLAQAMDVAIVALDTVDAHAFLGDGARFAAEKDTAGLAESISSALAKERNAAPRVPPAFRRSALAERLIAVYADARRSASEAT